MQMALDEAHEALKAGEIPIGAVVVCKDRVISRAHNLTETLCDVTAHPQQPTPLAASTSLIAPFTSPLSLAPCVQEP